MALPARSGSEPVDGHAFLTRLTDEIKKISDDDAAPNPVFTAMIAVNELEEAGLTRRPREATWNRPTLTNPAPVTGKPQGLAIVPAAAEMLRWKLRRRHG